MKAAQWHLEEAERLLAQSDEADANPDRPIWKKYSYTERARAHVELARAIRDLRVRPLGPPHPPGRPA